MDLLLKLPMLLGLGTAAGLNATLPLALVSLLVRLGFMQLGPPFDALGSDVAFYGLLVLAGLEFVADKVEGLEEIVHRGIMPALSLTAGAILAGSMSGVVLKTDPGLLILIGLLAGALPAGITYTIRSGLRRTLGRPLVRPGWWSLTEDGLALTLASASVTAPLLVPVMLAAGVSLVVLLWKLLVGRVGPAIRSFLNWLNQGAEPTPSQGSDDGFASLWGTPNQARAEATPVAPTMRPAWPWQALWHRFGNWLGSRRRVPPPRSNGGDRFGSLWEPKDDPSGADD
jgi:uncharacterized protein DUF4126